MERKRSFSHRTSKLPDPQRPHTRVEEGSVERKYTFGSVLGQGSFGVVKEVTSRLNGERFAVKIVNKDRVGFYTVGGACVVSCTLVDVQDDLANNVFARTYLRRD